MKILWFPSWFKFHRIFTWLYRDGTGTRQAFRGKIKKARGKLVKLANIRHFGDYNRIFIYLCIIGLILQITSFTYREIYLQFVFPIDFTSKFLKIFPSFRVLRQPDPLQGFHGYALIPYTCATNLCVPIFSRQVLDDCYNVADFEFSHYERCNV